MIVCFGCKYLDTHTTLPDGRHRCKLANDVYPNKYDLCVINRKNMGVYNSK